MKTLVVEDSQTCRAHLVRKLKTHLKNHGTVDTASDGEEAIDIFVEAITNQQPYDLICLDIEMPKMNGLETLKKIREIEMTLGIKTETKVKVVMTTTKDSPQEVLDTYKKHGCNDYFIKSADYEKLLSLVDKYNGYSEIASEPLYTGGLKQSVI